MDYATIAQDAADLLSDAGQVVSFLSHNAGTYSMQTGEVTGDGDAAGQDVYAATVPWDLQYIDAQKFEWDREFVSHYGTSVIMETVRCFMAALDVTGAVVSVKLGDRLVIGGEEFQIKGLMPIKPAGIVVLWDLAIKK